MSQIRVRMRPYVEPVVGVILLGVWWLLVAPRIVGYVPMRDDTFATNPYAVLVAIGFALAIAISRVRPGAALTLAGGLVALQLLFWPMRFGQSSWIAYLLLIALAGLRPGGRQTSGLDQVWRRGAPGWLDSIIDHAEVTALPTVRTL